ncbi:flagellar basal body protein FlgE [Shewanella eurypsychrophilus]|uniref:Flagellar hook protein FlgE n=1 Tax=Shewanella eurypsychrophilus TaxID=2593656 RepID=A0ABX6V0E6_9GAMM|nr:MULTISPECIES: flagellar hook protein FlgE [Shewanella]QFU20476.1 flagellar basal body protein FlaE [Shewanella sp. YLB-09]QFU20757.1 flagellar basal body protein FlaE [Shewanella sp. YLB-09]QPG56053.1 flagellar basal body protein FlgE [Shewanella eurypsychrophilus]
MSFNIALSGLQATTQDLNTISNNIANSSTVGFRGGRSEFSAIYNGGQAGGVNVMSTSQNFSMGGSLAYTGRELDMGIEGDGFFMLSASDGSTLYSRAGMFNQDANGYVTDPAGNRVQGYTVGPNGQLQNGNVSDLQIQSGSLPAKATTSVGQVSNLDASVDPITDAFDPDDSSTYHSSGTVTVYDSLGKEHAMTQYYVKTADNEWQVHYRMDGNDVGPAGGHSLEFDSDGNLTQGETLKLDIVAQGGASAFSIDLSYKNSTQYASAYNNSSLVQNGYTSGELNGIRIDDDGMLYGTYTNGQEQVQGQVVLASFNNPNGLTPVSQNAWTATNAAGQPVVGTPGTGTFGAVAGGYLEGSNVDQTAEMVNLMTAQRNYQSNAKVLQTNASMQQSLLNAI